MVLRGPRVWGFPNKRTEWDRNVLSIMFFLMLCRSRPGEGTVATARGTPVSRHPQGPCQGAARDHTCTGNGYWELAVGKPLVALKPSFIMHICAITLQATISGPTASVLAALGGVQDMVMTHWFPTTMNSVI